MKSAVIAKDQRLGALGGWPHPSKPLAIILLSHSGEASSVVEYVSGNGPSCPHLQSLWVNVPAGGRPFILKTSDVFCQFMSATPIVSGTTGLAA